jgi:hypothetical protein
MNELRKGFKTFEEAIAFKETIVGDYEIVGLYEGTFPGPAFAYFLKEIEHGN